LGDEIQAMKQIKAAMESLEQEEARRVLRWAVDKFGHGKSIDASEEVELERSTGNRQFQRIADLIDAANPTTTAEYVLACSYWFQQLEGDESVTGFQVNSALKDLGHGAGNITEAFSSLIDRTPRLARQVQKSGSSRQARKRYRLTEEGIRQVDRMFAGARDE
jgi:hypothetical protein